MGQKQSFKAVLRKVVLKNFANFTGKHLCWSPVLITLKTCNFIEKILQHMRFPEKFVNFLGTPFYRTHLVGASVNEIQTKTFLITLPDQLCTVTLGNTLIIVTKFKTPTRGVFRNIFHDRKKFMSDHWKILVNDLLEYQLICFFY